MCLKSAGKSCWKELRFFPDSYCALTEAVPSTVYCQLLLSPEPKKIYVKWTLELDPFFTRIHRWWNINEQVGCTIHQDWTRIDFTGWIITTRGADIYSCMVQQIQKSLISTQSKFRTIKHNICFTENVVVGKSDMTHNTALKVRADHFVMDWQQNLWQYLLYKSLHFFSAWEGYSVIFTGVRRDGGDGITSSGNYVHKQDKSCSPSNFSLCRELHLRSTIQKLNSSSLEDTLFRHQLSKACSTAHNTFPHFTCFRCSPLPNPKTLLQPRTT